MYEGDEQINCQKRIGSGGEEQKRWKVKELVLYNSLPTNHSCPLLYTNIITINMSPICVFDSPLRIVPI